MLSSARLPLSTLLAAACLLLVALADVQVADASACPGADPCPWTKVDTFAAPGDGEFRAPYGMGQDAAGNLYVLENDTHRVQKLDPTGGFLAKWGGVGSAAGDLYFPEDIAVDAAAGAVYVVDSGNYRIEKFDTSGEFVSAWGRGVADGSPAYQVCTTQCQAGTSSPTADAFKYPTGIATDGANVYVADQNNASVHKFDLAGGLVGGWTIPGSQKPQKIAVSAGMVYVTTRADTVWRFDTNGVPDTGWDGDGVTGSSGGGPGQLDHPQGIAVDATGAYVTDSDNQRIVKFDLNGGFAAAWGSEGSADGQFMWPYGVTAAGGSVWVADTYNHRLQKFDQAGAYKRSVGAPLGLGDLYWPSDVAPAPSGGGVYVANWGAKDIQRFDESGAAIGRWSTAPSLPASISPTANGLFVPDAINHVSLYDFGGSLLNKFGSPGSDPGEFNYPYGSAIDAQGNLYVADLQNNRVQKLDPTGSPLAVFGSVGSGDGQLHGPMDVAVDHAGNVFVADTGNHRIEKFGPAGNFLTKWGSAGSGGGQFATIRGLTIDSEGHLFVSDDENQRIQEFDGDGNLIAKWGARGDGPGELSRPEGLTVDSAGGLWVADNQNHRIVRFCCPAAQGGPGPAPGSGPAPDPQGTPDTKAPRIGLKGRSVQRSKLVGRRGVALRVVTSERARITFRAVLSKRDARRLGLHTRVIARSAQELATAQTRALRLRLTAGGRRALARTRRLRMVVRAGAADPAGNRSTASMAVRVVR